MSVKIVNGFPPNIDKIREHFDIGENVIFTYGDTIYNPGGGHIDVPLTFHEMTHVLQQQSMGAVEWWEKYLNDPEFRLLQEVEAYHNQYKKFCWIDIDKNRQSRFLYQLASDLCGKTYGYLCRFGEARRMIKNGKIIKT